MNTMISMTLIKLILLISTLTISKKLKANSEGHLHFIKFKNDLSTKSISGTNLVYRYNQMTQSGDGTIEKIITNSELPKPSDKIFKNIVSDPLTHL